MLSKNQNVKKSKTIRRRITWLVSIVVVVLLSGFSWFYFKGNTQQAQAAAATYNTSAVRRGDLRVAAKGTGALIAGNTANASFPSSGIVGEVNVKVGDRVTEGQVLARLKDLDSLKANVASDELALVQAQNTLNNLNKNAGVNVAQAYMDWITAQKTYSDAQGAQARTNMTRCSKEVTARYAGEYATAAQELNNRDIQSSDYVFVRQRYDTAYGNWVYCASYTADEKTNAKAALAVAENKLKLAETTYKTLSAAAGVDPDQLSLAKARLEAAQTRLDVDQKNLAAATLTAPISGTVISVAGGQGEMADTSVFIVISDLDHPTVKVQVTQADIDKLVLGNKTEVTFDALPGRIFTGKVTLVQPALVSAGNYQAIQGTIALDEKPTSSGQPLPLGVSASVSVISKEAKGTLYIVKEALRDLGGGQYAVFVLENNQLRLKTVQVGLITDTYAEIKSGLNPSDKVSTGAAQIKS